MPTWDELFKREEFRWREPYPRVIEFAKLLKERGARRILDLGCGTGRHLIYLAKEGFEPHGVDLSPTGLEYARKWLEQEGLSAQLKEGDMTAIPYPDRFFDAAISIHVIYHGTLEQMRKAISELYRVLRPGGLALLTFQSRRSYRYGQGRELEPHTFIPDIGADAGLPHHFSDLCELEEVLERFIVREIRLVEQVHHEDGRRSSHWEVLIEKPTPPRGGPGDPHRAGEVMVRPAEREEFEEFAAQEWRSYNEEVGVVWDSRRYYLLAELEGCPVGLAAFHIVGGVGHLDQLLVAKAHRGRGIGSRLLEEFERLGREEGCHKLTLETAEFQARGFYERHGFTVVCTLGDNKFHRDWHLLEKAL